MRHCLCTMGPFNKTFLSSRHFVNPRGMYKYKGILNSPKLVYIRENEASDGCNNCDDHLFHHNYCYCIHSIYALISRVIQYHDMNILSGNNKLILASLDCCRLDGWMF
jgi:hypothetical protein